MGPTHPLDYHNWVEKPYEHKDDPTDWIASKPSHEIETFWIIALGIFLQLDRVRFRPELTKFVLNMAPDTLWAAFCSPWAWFWEVEDWDFRWDTILRQTYVLLGGYPVDAYPVCIPTSSDSAGESTISWTIPYRWSVAPYRRPGSIC